jgi:hypothetical protein
MRYQALKRNEETFSAYHWVKKVNLKRLYDNNYMIFWLKKIMKTIKRSVITMGSGKRKRAGGIQKRFLGQWNILCDTTIFDTCHPTFAKTHGIYDTKSEL